MSLRTRPPRPITLCTYTRGRERAMASRIVEYRAEAARCEQKAKKARDRAEREWQMVLARAYLMLAEAEAERSTSLRNSSQ